MKSLIEHDLTGNAVDIHVDRQLTEKAFEYWCRSDRHKQSLGYEPPAGPVLRCWQSLVDRSRKKKYGVMAAVGTFGNSNGAILFSVPLDE